MCYFVWSEMTTLQSTREWSHPNQYKKWNSCVCILSRILQVTFWFCDYTLFAIWASFLFTSAGCCHVICLFQCSFPLKSLDQFQPNNDFYSQLLEIMSICLMFQPKSKKQDCQWLKKNDKQSNQRLIDTNST